MSSFNRPTNVKPTSFADAVKIARNAGHAARQFESPGVESVSVADAVGRVVIDCVRSHVATPSFDNSAMDGYAVSSKLTANASRDTPLLLRIKGTIAAGESPINLPCEVGAEGMISCVEVMTGAAFPHGTGGLEFDACIQWEHARRFSEEGVEEKVVEIERPPKPGQNRRLAGGDFQRGDVILSSGDIVGPQHIMAMVSVGIGTVRVQKRLKALILTTGDELQSRAATQAATQGIACTTSPRIPDCNGPYLVAALRSIGFEVKCTSGVSDDMDELRAKLRKACIEDNDILITTGGVSAGKFDFVPQALAELGGSTHFHHVAMRPGHPVLFGSLPGRQNTHMPIERPVFGLPGNPIAAAACYRFIVVPYLRALQGQQQEAPMSRAVLLDDDGGGSTRASETRVRPDSVVGVQSRALDCFRHAQYRPSRYGNEVILSREQSPAKIRPFGGANCWVHIPSDLREPMAGDIVDCYAL